MKEIYCVTSALSDRSLYYESIENWRVLEMPEAKGANKKTRRQRLVTDNELSEIIAALMKEPEGKQSFKGYDHRVRLAHTLEFGCL